MAWYVIFILGAFAGMLFLFLLTRKNR